MKYFIEYEIPPLRAIYYKEVEATSQANACQMVLREHPGIKIRAVRQLPEKKP